MNSEQLHQRLASRAREIIFGPKADRSIEEELSYAVEVDRAHLVMLLEQNILDPAPTLQLLQAIEDLRDSHYVPLLGQSAPQGLFFLLENYLIETQGAAVGGLLQTARSRNDLNATTLRLRLRGPYLRLMTEALRLLETLVRFAHRYRTTVMPAYTHFQPAVPVTYGHYLAGIGLAIGRDLRGLVAASDDLQRCPLGAGAIGGTTIPINPHRTAELLGFESPSLNSIDAVASRDIVLRLLSSGAILGLTLSRFAADLLLWTTQEFGFIVLPDGLVGVSSMMPQKRNPFLLEHIQGRSSSVIAGFIGAAISMHAKPFTNSAAVGTEAIRQIWSPLQDLTDAIELVRLVVSAAQPRPKAMLRRAEESYTVATELTNRLTLAGMDFRSSHRWVSKTVKAAIAAGKKRLDVAVVSHLPERRKVNTDHLDPISIVKKSVYGGGPAETSIESCLEKIRENIGEVVWQLKHLRSLWFSSKIGLTKTVAQLLGRVAVKVGQNSEKIKQYIK